jgi:hypothetical protein
MDSGREAFPSDIEALKAALVTASLLSPSLLRD